MASHGAPPSPGFDKAVLAWLAGVGGIIAAVVNGLFGKRNTDKQTDAQRQATAVAAASIEAHVIEIADKRVSEWQSANQAVIDEWRTLLEAKDDQLTTAQQLIVELRGQVAELLEKDKRNQAQIDQLLESNRKVTSALQNEKRKARELAKVIKRNTDLEARIVQLEQDKAVLLATARHEIDTASDGMYRDLGVERDRKAPYAAEGVTK